jgi:hypothetical protein
VLLDAGQNAEKADLEFFDGWGETASVDCCNHGSDLRKETAPMLGAVVSGTRTAPARFGSENEKAERLLAKPLGLQGW